MGSDFYDTVKHEQWRRAPHLLLFFGVKWKYRR